MTRKTSFIAIVILITIILIGTLRYFIKKDTIQTQTDRLHFYSENLDIQKKTILNLYENYSTLLIEGINYNSNLINRLKSLNLKNTSNSDDILLPIRQNSLSYYQHLRKAGFAFLTYSILTPNNQLYRISIGNNQTKIDLDEDTVLYFKQSGKIPSSTYFVNENTLNYRFTYPIPLTEKSSNVFIETGIDFSQLRKMIMGNITDCHIGFLYIGDESQISGLSGSDMEFIEVDKKSHLFFDKEIIKEIQEYLNVKTLDEIAIKLLNNKETVTTEKVSLYLSSKLKPKAISFSHLGFMNNDGNFFLVAVNHDSMLDKTDDWNNQIFLIYLIIILLIMIGITYLFISRVSLIREKKFIKESEIKLMEINASKDKFFSIIAHDLKNPFNGIMGMTSYLNESYDQIDNKERKEIINDLNISSKNAYNLLQNLLEWTRTQSGTIKNVPVKIEPKDIIEIALETVTNLAKNKEIEIKQTIITDKYGFADENLVATILRNLFTNAVKFSPRNSVIEVNVKDYEKELVFCVKDFGIGLKHEEIDKLFRIDLNFHKKGTEDEPGTGLGLKICKEFVEYCNGRIWVVSEAMNGSCFYFTIPLYS